MKCIINCSNVQRRIFQYLAAIAANLGMLSLGIHYGWPSLALPVLLDGSYSFKMDDSHASWMITMTPLGAVIGDFLAGATLNTLGRKKMIMYSAIPLTLSWILVGIANSSVYLFIARGTAGIVDGMLFTAIPPYLAEIADPEIRGFLGSTYFVSLVFGMMISNVMLLFMSIPTCAYISATLSCLMLLILPFLPETPYYHLMKNEMLKAKESLQKFRGKGEVTDELGRISKGLMEEEKLGKGSLKELFTNPFNRKCLILTLFLTAVQQLSGVLAIQSYSASVFKETKDFIDPNIANLIYYILYFLATLIALVLVDISGRRPLILISTAIVHMSLVINGTYLYIKNFTSIDVAGYEYIQIVAILVFIVSFSSGLNNIPVLICSEIFPSHIKGKAFCVVNLAFSVVSTASIQYFSWATDMFGMHVPFYTYAACTLLGTVLIYFSLPETKKKTLEDIQEEMKTNKTSIKETNGVV